MPSTESSAAGNGGVHSAPPSLSTLQDTTAAATDEQHQVVELAPGLARIRLRRKLFFATVILYMPLMWAVSKVSPTFRSMAFAFGVWVTVLFFTALYAALARCPRCGHYFHMNGMSLLFLRRCLHCQLHVTEDRKAH